MCGNDIYYVILAGIVLICCIISIIGLIMEAKRTEKLSKELKELEKDPNMERIGYTFMDEPF